jgi:hypothetical protein
MREEIHEKTCCQQLASLVQNAYMTCAQAGDLIITSVAAEWESAAWTINTWKIWWVCPAMSNAPIWRLDKRTVDWGCNRRYNRWEQGMKKLSQGRCQHNLGAKRTNCNVWNGKQGGERGSCRPGTPSSQLRKRTMAI